MTTFQRQRDIIHFTEHEHAHVKTPMCVSRFLNNSTCISFQNVLQSYSQYNTLTFKCCFHHCKMLEFKTQGYIGIKLCLLFKPFFDCSKHQRIIDRTVLLQVQLHLHLELHSKQFCTCYFSASEMFQFSELQVLMKLLHRKRLYLFLINFGFFIYLGYPHYKVI